MKLVLRKSLNEKSTARLKKKVRIRRRVIGTMERPRLTVYRSNSNLYVQIINDETGSTLVSASSLAKGTKLGKSMDSAKKLGSQIAKLAIDKNIHAVVFDRNGYMYHGKVKALAEAAREAGLKF